jgi:hypothetical protein
MSPKPVLLDALCTDCVSLRSPAPKPATTRSERCREHQRQRDAWLSAGRNRRSRAKAAGKPVSTSSAAWAAAYVPQPLPGTARGLLLTAEDIAELRAVLSELVDAQLAAANADRLGDPNAVKAGLRQLLNAAYETSDTVKHIVEATVAEVRRPRGGV